MQGILALMGSKLAPVIASTAKAEIEHMKLDTGKARNQLGWSPELDFEAGLRRTIGWYRENQGLYA